MFVSFRLRALILVAGHNSLILKVSSNQHRRTTNRNLYLPRHVRLVRRQIKLGSNAFANDTVEMDHRINKGVQDGGEMKQNYTRRNATTYTVVGI